MSARAPASEVAFDWRRRERIGIAEAVLCAGKSVDQIAAIVAQARARGARLLLTRLAAADHAALAERAPAGTRLDENGGALDYDPLSRTAVLGPLPAPTRGLACIVTAGTADAPVAREAERTLAFEGIAPTMVFDVGVAGPHRLAARLEEIAGHRVVIVVAGMDAALGSVLAAQLAGPVIGVPTSTGYGAARAGETALAAMLASCAAGLAVVNIDNGFGAACAALRLLRAMDATA